MKLIPPFDGIYPITQRFGERFTDPNGHTGIDFALPPGTAVRAAAGGTVAECTHSKKGYGTFLRITHQPEGETIYAHLSAIQVRPGQRVEAGDVIALSGNSGNSTGPHLHFEMRIGGKPIDPERFWRPEEEPAAGARWQVLCPLLNVRSGPGIFYPVIGNLKKGSEIIEEAQQTERWIRFDGNRWAAADFQGQRLMSANSEKTDQ